MVGVHITIMSNVTLPGVAPPLFSAALCSPWHDFLAPPPALTPTPYAPTFESPVPILWPPGFALQQNKLTTTVIHRFQFIMLDGHDCGAMIPHVSVPAANLMLPIVMAFSSRKVLFSSSTVRANGAAIGCSQMGWPAIPMLTCGAPVSLPTTTPPLNALNNVEVGMSTGDILAGSVAIALSMLTDVLNYAAKIRSAARAASAGPVKKVLQTTPAEAIGKVLSGVRGKLLGGSNIGAFATKAVLGVVAGAAKIGLTGDGNVKVAVGTNYAGGSVSLTATRDGKKQYTFQAQAGFLPVGGSASVQRTDNPDGTHANQTARTASTPFLQDQSKSKTDYDTQGHEKKRTDSELKTAAATPLPETGVIAVAQTKTTTTPGNAPESSHATFGGGGSPVGRAQFWGPSL